MVNLLYLQTMIHRQASLCRISCGACLAPSSCDWSTRLTNQRAPPSPRSALTLPRRNNAGGENGINSQVEQRVLKYLKRTTFSCSPMIRLLAHPLPPSPVGKLSLFLRLLVSPVALTDGRGGGGVGEEPNHTTARKPGPL
jgi:hypothetical protein